MTKSPTDVDRQIGNTVRVMRQLAGCSQQKLADALGLTFQQVQKYEKGTNRISAGRLQQIAVALEVPLSTLLGDDAPKAIREGTTGLLAQFLELPEAANIIRVWCALPSHLQDRGLDLIVALKRGDKT